jgi:hypothetical protein
VIAGLWRLMPMLIDSTSARARQHGIRRPTPKKTRRSSHQQLPCRLTTKIHTILDALGNPVALSAG